MEYQPVRRTFTVGERLGGQAMYERWSAQGVRVVPSVAEFVLPLVMFWFSLHFLGVFGLASSGALREVSGMLPAIGWFGLIVSIPQTIGMSLAWLGLLRPMHNPRVLMLLAGVFFWTWLTVAFAGAGSTLGIGPYMGFTLIQMGRVIDVSLHNGHGS